MSLRIPAIGVSADIAALGLNSDRTIKVPKRPERAGWYWLGPAPGQDGSAVIIGHRDSKTGPAVFYRLASLRRGDHMTVTLADGRVADFVVNKVATFRNRDFPARRVYGSHGFPALQLVTCGGAYDRVAHTYRANVVVFTSFVSVASARRAAPGGRTG
jgi:LPXTG-site transpeptidase (sortase) family protein